jgi:CO dehydrogenase maturation factor
MKLALTGKGGVGKSTLAAALARSIAADRPVMAIDADPDMNLAGALGVEQPPPITRETELIEDRTGSSGGLVQMQPEVEDVLRTYATAFGTAGRLVTIGPPEGGGTGCMCPENNFIRTLVTEALDYENVIMDMEAGIEHLGRGTAGDMDAMIVIVEPSLAAIDTAHQIRSLAEDVGIDDVFAFSNRVRNSTEATMIHKQLELPILGRLDYDGDVATAGLEGSSPVDASPALRSTARELLDSVDERVG